MTLVKCSLFAVAFLASVSASAKTCTWIGSTGDWTDETNWQDGAVPEDGDDVVFQNPNKDGGEISLKGGTTAKLASLTAKVGSGWNIQGGTLALMPGERVIENDVTVKIPADLASDDAVVLVKRGTGTLSLSGANTATTQFVVEGGRLQPESEEAYGPVPETYKADAIVLRNGAALSRPDVDNLTVVIGSTRGITLDGSGALCARGIGTLQVDAPIVGDGDLLLLRQSGGIRLNAVNSYTGRTRVACDGAYAFQNALTVRLGADGALPATTTVVGEGKSGQTVVALVYLEGTTQRVTSIETSDGPHLIFNGPGTLRFGTDADGDIPLQDVFVSAGATLAYAGAGTLVAPVHSSADATLALESGALVLPAGNALGSCVLRLAADRTVTLAAGVSELPNNLVLEGNATLAAAESQVNLLGSLTGAGTLSVTGADAVTFGTTDAVLRALDVPIAGADVTLDGWVRATVDPSAYAKAATCTLVGPYSGLSEGDVVLDGTAAGVDDIAQIGASASVTVRNGGRFVISAQADMTASNAFTIDAESKVSVGGPAMVDLTGATFTGGGELNLVGAGVTLVGDLTGVRLKASEAGTVNVPEGQTLTVGEITGTSTIRKTGLGTLVFAGQQASICHLLVEAGEVRAATAVPMLANVTVKPGARLVLDADEQIRDDNYVFLEGTFDLNGHTETIQRLHNESVSGTLRDTPTGQLVNMAETPAVITTKAEDIFYGAIREAPGKIEFRTQAANTSFFGPTGSAVPSKVVVDSTGCYFSYTRFRNLRFCFKKMRDPSRVPALADIQFTYQGRTLAPTLVNSVTGNSLVSGSQYGYLSDGKASTVWKAAAGATDVYVEVQFTGTYPRVDGYRFVPAELENAPTDWEVYAYRADRSGWFLVDRRENEVVGPEKISQTDFANNPGKTYAFSFADRPREQLGTGTAVELTSGGTYHMRVSSLETLSLGALSGKADVRLEDGSWIAPGNMSDWTGSFIFQNTDGRENMARVLLDAGLGGDAQTVRVKGDNTNVSVENAGTAPVSLLVDDATTSTRLRLADGNGPMGLIKRGTGTVTLDIEESANTGTTVVEEGTLKVSGPLGAERLAKPVRYLRFSPTCVVGGAAYMDTYNFNWGAGDIQLLDAAGAVVPWPAGTTISAPWGGHASATLANLIDGDPATRGLVFNRDQKNNTAELTPVTIDTKTGVAFVGYRWYTSNGSSDRSRTPTNWILETSDDGEAWTVVSTGSQKWGGTDKTSTANPRGPFTRDGVTRPAAVLATLPSGFFAEATNRATRASALTARYFRFAPHETYNPSGSQYGYGWMVAEFALFRNGTRVDWPAGASATVTGGKMNTVNGSKVQNLCDNVVSGGFENSTLHRTFVTQMPSWAVIDAGEEVVFDGYGFYSAALGGYSERIPVSWTFSVSTDGTTWHEVDNRVQERSAVKVKEYTLQGIWSVADKFPLLDAADATDALGDASPVEIRSGATLAVDSVYEKFGPLSGAGTLALAGGSVAEINACAADADAFSGTVTGSGTLAVCGDQAQTFDNATLAVPTLELNGGVVAGAASFGGNDLALACNGGALWGTLSGVGTLSLTGAPKIALPADTFEQGGARVTLVEAASIPADVQAAFRAAEIVRPDDLPGNWKATVSVSATTVKVSVGAAGTVLLFR